LVSVGFNLQFCHTLLFHYSPVVLYLQHSLLQSLYKNIYSVQRPFACVSITHYYMFAWLIHQKMSLGHWLQPIYTGSLTITSLLLPLWRSWRSVWL